MKFLLVLIIALWTTAVCSTPSEEITFESLSPKEKIRVFMLDHLVHLKYAGIERICSRQLTPEQIVLGTQKLGEFVDCSNVTFNMLADKLDDNVNFDELRNLVRDKYMQNMVPEFARPVCEVFIDTFRCLTEQNSVIDICLNEHQKVLKNNLFAIIPLIHQAACLRDGALISEIFKHDDGARCIRTTIDVLGTGLKELFGSESNELFGDRNACQIFNDVVREYYTEVGNCSLDVLDMVKDMVGFFCDSIRCDRFIYDLKCY